MKKNYKRIVLLFIVATVFQSCSSIKQIGKVNMISTRNVDSQINYELISSYSGGSKKELRSSKAVSIEEAIDKTVRKIPGGEFLMNAKMYAVIKGKTIYFAVEGDVWGKKLNVSYRGFKVGDKISFKSMGSFKIGKIISLKDDNTCLIEIENGEIIEKKYDEISKTE